MIATLFALWHGPMSNWDFIDWFCFLIAVGAVIAITAVALKYFGITVPPEIIRIIMIVVIAVVAIGAVLLIASMVR